jgi:membrane protease YdiL (CAAX protease family)
MWEDKAMNVSVIIKALKQAITVRWKPTWDLAVVAISWGLVVGTLYIATIIIGADFGGGIPYFIMYAIIGATIFGVGIPLFWMIGIKRRPIVDLGITRQRLWLSIVLQIVFATFQYFQTLAKIDLPSLKQFIPLLFLALSIGFFEAFFWRGWVLLRLEEAFGIIPAILLSSFLYAAYHIGYAMPAEEMIFLFFIGVMFAVVFRITRSVFILWPIFQPMGQLVTLTKEGLTLPFMATFGFLDALIIMWVLVWIANRYYMKHSKKESGLST